MDSGVPAGASSSASAKEYLPLRMTIRELEQTAPGVWKITPAGGSAFFLREDYLSSLSARQLEEARLSPSPSELSESQSGDLLSAALCYAAEQLAMASLARSEQCRRSLASKLCRKGLADRDIQAALDYLEGAGCLDDRRFAGAWLRSRSIHHAEGRLRLGAELAARGIDRDDAEDALDEFFSEHDEYELCRKALAKVWKGDQDKAVRSLMRKGFTMAQIRAAMAGEDGLPA